MVQSFASQKLYLAKAAKIAGCYGEMLEEISDLLKVRGYEVNSEQRDFISEAFNSFVEPKEKSLEIVVKEKI